MNKLAIIGLGLMGGSLGLAAKKRKVAREVWGYARREETRKAALAHGMVDRAFENPSDAVKDADMVVICLPVLSIPDIAAQFAASLQKDCVVTDVGSTKAEIVCRMDKILKQSKAIFVGSHPIAGSDQTGLAAATVDLFDKAAVIVTPTSTRIDKPVSSVRRFWEGVGARVFIMSPKDHDVTVAKTSHLPHLVAAMLVRAVLYDGADLSRFCGTGFRDATRIAAGSEDLWHDIVKSNRRSVLAEMDKFEKILCEVTKMVKNGDFNSLRDFLADNRTKRCNFEERFNRERKR